MLAETIRTLYRYTDWANQRLFAVIGSVSETDLQAPAPGGARSIHESLLHMLETHRGWLSWWDGSLSPGDAIRLSYDRAAFPAVDAVAAEWGSVKAQTDVFLARLDDELVVSTYTSTLPNGQTFEMPLWPMMLHVANHGTQHRSEIAAVTTALGHSPGDLDLVYYFRTAGEGA